MFARVGLLARASALSVNNANNAANEAAVSSPGGPSAANGERPLLPLPAAGTTDPLAFLVDDTMSELMKVKRYSASALPLQRICFLRRIAAVSRMLGGVGTAEHCIPILERLVSDTEAVIRQAVAIECAHVAQVLAAAHTTTPAPAAPAVSESLWPDPWDETTAPTPFPPPWTQTPTNEPKSPTSAPASPTHADIPQTISNVQRSPSYDVICTALLPIITTLLTDANAEVRTSACDSLVAISGLLSEEDIGKSILTTVLNLAHDERDEQRTVAVQLMHELAPLLGHDLCRSFVALELAAFADDAMFRVRKTTAQCFANVCQQVGPSFTVSKLLPCYVRLSKDLIWGVRKGVVDSLVAVAKCVPADVRKEIFVPMMERFVKDNSRWVRNGAFEVIGPFIHAIGAELVTKELLALYANVPAMSAAVVDPEVVFSCAYNLPAVVATVGPSRWESELLPAFTQLCNGKVNVKRSLACSLHEIARVIGPQLTQAHLVPAVDAFLRDVDEVRGGMIASLARMLQCLDVHRREIYVEVLWTVQKQKEKWRWRLAWAKQLIAFSRLFDSDTTSSAMIPLTFALCRDSVYIVRMTAARAMGHLLKRLQFDQSPGADACLHAIKTFASGVTYMDRQLFIRMCEGMIGVVDVQTFERELIDILFGLSNDATANVRIVLSELISSLATKHAEYIHNKMADFNVVLARLRADEDADVRDAVTAASSLQRQRSNSVIRSSDADNDGADIVDVADVDAQLNDITQRDGADDADAIERDANVNGVATDTAAVDIDDDNSNGNVILASDHEPAMIQQIDMSSAPAAQTTSPRPQSPTIYTRALEADVDMDISSSPPPPQSPHEPTQHTGSKEIIATANGVGIKHADVAAAMDETTADDVATAET